MEEQSNSFFGARKIKSIIAVLICFVLWQIVRIIFHDDSLHPTYAYLYAIIEMRNSIEKMKSMAKERAIVSLIGILLALSAIAFMDLIGLFNLGFIANTAIEFAVIIMGILLALNIASKAGCRVLCAIAATTFIICFVYHSGPDRYAYAFLRYLQTLLGMGIAFFVNCFILKPKN